MIYKIEWTFNAEVSFFEEAQFILQKWNIFEVNIFESLVENELSRLSIHPTIGNFKSDNVYSLSISEQTKLFYKINKDLSLIELLLFWNNLRNPDDLIKLI
jgi:hypothetical protein